MNKISMGGYERISKRAAENRYNAGNVVYIIACNLRPDNMYSPAVPCQKERYTEIGGDGFNTIVARNREFETVCNAFQYYNCCSETGRYPAFYVRNN
ncbi:MAG: hypothetical protein IJ523_07905 [Succinivibrionaceae bacterium]|nr:hypothetical protein [Succinivibrionaceae bacterium]